MRMAELAARSGVARETIHFYLREGLLPRPEKGGRTVAYYTEEHLDRLRLIRRLREEKYLPIAVIRRLLESPAAAERDVDVLADVLHLIAPGDELGGAPSAAAVARAPLAVAEARGLLGGGRRRLRHGGRRRAKLSRSDPAERRVLGVIEDAVRLEDAARRLTLDDLEACAPSLSALVGREATLFFDAMFESGDIGGSIAALRQGRGAVARFIAAYRDLMLRRVVEEVLVGLERGPEAVLRAATVPLSPAPRGGARRAPAPRRALGRVAARRRRARRDARSSSAPLRRPAPPRISPRCRRRSIARAGVRLGAARGLGRARERAQRDDPRGARPRRHRRAGPGARPDPARRGDRRAGAAAAPRRREPARGGDPGAAPGLHGRSRAGPRADRAGLRLVPPREAGAGGARGARARRARDRVAGAGAPAPPGRGDRAGGAGADRGERSPVARAVARGGRRAGSGEGALRGGARRWIRRARSGGWPTRTSPDSADHPALSSRRGRKTPSRAP